MKFLVNRVHDSSFHNEHDIQEMEVIINDDLLESNVEGWVKGYFQIGHFCNAFTIAEIDDENYLL